MRHHRGVSTDDLCLKHQMVDELESAARDAADCLRSGGARHVGEKAKPPKVHTKHGDLLVRHPAGGAEDRAVAADDHDDVGGQGAGGLLSGGWRWSQE